MARAYANIVTTIWLDEEFCALSAGAQRTYFMLLTQTDITACGTLPLTTRRWAATLREADRPDLPGWLDELARERFIIIDHDTEELLVRKFVKWDGGYKHAKRVMAVIATAEAIRSRSLQSVIATELANLGVSTRIAVPPDSEPDPSPVDGGSGRVVVTEVVQESTPGTSLLEGEPAPLDSVEPPSEFCSSHPKGTEKPCGPCKTARMRYQRWVNATEAEAEANRRAAERARIGCPDCSGETWIVDADGTSRKCSHRRTA